MIKEEVDTTSVHTPVSKTKTLEKSLLLLCLLALSVLCLVFVRSSFL